MKDTNVFFSFNGVNLAIQCIIEDKMISICEKYSHKIDKEIDSLLFLYRGNQINFNLKLKE